MIAFFLVLLGLLFIYLEFFLPGVILGIGGGALLIAGFLHFFFENHHLLKSILFVLGELIALFLLSRLALWQIKRTRNKNALYLQTDQEGYCASLIDKQLIGKQGVAITDLKPAGHIQIEGVNKQALSQLGYIEKSSPITVVDGRGSYYIVIPNKDLL